MDPVFVTNQVRHPVVTVEQYADVLVGILFVAMPRFRELPQNLDAVIEAENNLPCGFFVVAGDIVVDLLSQYFASSVHSISAIDSFAASFRRR